MDETHKQLTELLDLLENGVKAAREDVERNFESKASNAYTPDSLAVFFGAMTYAFVAPLKGYARKIGVPDGKVLGAVARIAMERQGSDAIFPGRES